MVTCYQLRMCRTPSKEMMQQYGFVPEGGNAADRIPFRCALLMRHIYNVVHQPITVIPSVELACMCSKAIIAGRTLSLPRIEQLLGEQVFMQMLGGQHRHVTAVIKSLPLHEDGDPAGPLPEKERQLAESLRHQCVSMMEGAVHLQMTAETSWSSFSLNFLAFPVQCIGVALWLLFNKAGFIVDYVWACLQAGEQLSRRTLNCLLLLLRMATPGCKQSLGTGWIGRSC